MKRLLSRCGIYFMVEATQIDCERIALTEKEIIQLREEIESMFKDEEGEDRWIKDGMAYGRILKS